MDVSLYSLVLIGQLTEIFAAFLLLIWYICRTPPACSTIKVRTCIAIQSLVVRARHALRKSPALDVIEEQIKMMNEARLVQRVQTMVRVMLVVSTLHLAAGILFKNMWHHLPYPWTGYSQDFEKLSRSNEVTKFIIQAFAFAFAALPRLCTARSVKACHLILYLWFIVQVLCWTAFPSEEYPTSCLAHSMTIVRFIVDAVHGDSHLTIALNLPLTAAYCVAMDSHWLLVHIQIFVMVALCGLTSLIAWAHDAEVRGEYKLEVERATRARFLAATMDGSLTVKCNGEDALCITDLDKQACEVFQCSESAIGRTLEQLVDNPSGFAALAVDAKQSQSGPALLRTIEFSNMIGQTISAQVYAVSVHDSVVLAMKIIEDGRPLVLGSPTHDVELPTEAQVLSALSTNLTLIKQEKRIMPRLSWSTQAKKQPNRGMSFEPVKEYEQPWQAGMPWRSLKKEIGGRGAHSILDEATSRNGVDVHDDEVSYRIDILSIGGEVNSRHGIELNDDAVSYSSSAPTFKSMKIDDLNDHCGGQITNAFSEIKQEHFRCHMNSHLHA